MSPTEEGGTAAWGIPNIEYFSLPLLGGQEDRHSRLQQLQGDVPTTGQLIRSPSSLLPSTASDGLEVTVLVPEITFLLNSKLPYSFNEDNLSVGRGVSTKATGGVAVRYRNVSLVLAPQVVASQNRPYQVIEYPAERTPARDPFASPWYYPPESLDRPQRFGEESVFSVAPGQSSLTVNVGGLAVGAATESLWWGPGRVNALVMSNNAPGFPHLFLRTARPIRTGIGDLEGMWITGRLRNSAYFAADGSRDTRSMSGLVLVFHPSPEPNLALGVARGVYAELDGDAFPLHALNVFRDVGRPAAAASRNEPPGDADQIFSLFGRWVFPESGLEIYGEWGRTERPASLRDFLAAPHHTQGYTVGLQWVSDVGEEGKLAFSAEASDLELSSTYRSRPVLSWYTSPAVEAGYTHEGRVLGAATGPGSSSQWGSVEFILPRYSLGVYGGRVRWDNGVFYTRAPRVTYHGHDVSLHSGIRGSVEFNGFLMTADFGASLRYNYLFQHLAWSNADIESVDVVNHSLRFGLGRAPRR